MKKWKTYHKCFDYVADKEFLGTHFIVLFWHIFNLPDFKLS